MVFDAKQLLRHFAALGALVLSALPFLIHFLLLTQLPAFHLFMRESLDYIWRYHIADSGVTVGLAYYVALVFALWRTRRSSWRAFSLLMEEFNDTFTAGLARPFWTLERRALRMEVSVEAGVEAETRG